MVDSIEQTDLDGKCIGCVQVRKALVAALAQPVNRLSCVPAPRQSFLYIAARASACARAHAGSCVTVIISGLDCNHKAGR